LRSFVGRLLSVLAGAEAQLLDGEPPSAEPVADAPAWESIQRSRRPDRPGVRALLRRAASKVTELHGTGEGESDHGLLLALARFGGTPCVVLGQDRDPQRTAQLLGPAGLRTARRGMRLAAELRLPLLTIVDTPGASLSRAAEQGGLAGQIARCVADMVTLPTPTLCLLLGQGAGGAALALLPADRVLCAQHAWLSPLPPEGASAILHRSTDRAPELAAGQGIRSTDLLRNGIVDRILAERPDAADEAEAFLDRLAQVLAGELAGLAAQPAGLRYAARLERYRNLGLAP
jgi:acetyl-CoA carboxylase alpha subunit